MSEEGLFEEMIHVKKMNQGRWRVMEVCEEDFEMMMAYFVEGWVVEL